MFNASAGQSDPYLNIYLRQPIPGTGFLPGHMDAVIDVRNLLAQGYVPLLGQDGRTVYLVQSARSIRGGVAFSFRRQSSVVGRQLKRHNISKECRKSFHSQRGQRIDTGSPARRNHTGNQSHQCHAQHGQRIAQCIVRLHAIQG